MFDLTAVIVGVIAALLFGSLMRHKAYGDEAVGIPEGTALCPQAYSFAR